jgi:hypothetical protein
MAHDRVEDIVASAVAEAGRIDVPELLKERLRISANSTGRFGSNGPPGSVIRPPFAGRMIGRGAGLRVTAYGCGCWSDEQCRLAALNRYEVLDTGPEKPFDRITGLVQTVIAVPIVAVSLVDVQRQPPRRSAEQAGRHPRPHRVARQAGNPALPVLDQRCRSGASGCRALTPEH